MSHLPYLALARFTDPARAKPELWRLGATLLIATFAFAMFSNLLLLALADMLGPLWTLAVRQGFDGGRRPEDVLAVLASFLPLALALALALRLIHDRGWPSLFGPWPSARRAFLASAAAVLALALALLPVQLASPSAFRHLTLAQQLPWAMPAIGLIVLQAATEEALFRGYMLQQLAARFATPLAWMVIPSMLFALLHLDLSDPFPDRVWSVAISLVFGLLAADLTARTGNLGAAVGLHVAQNLSGILLIGLYGRMDGLALWNIVLDPAEPWAGLPFMASDALGLLVAWLLVRLVLRV